MLIKLSDLIRKYGIQLTGVLHVGAHECEEMGDYDRYISRDRVLWIEAMSNKVSQNLEKFPNILIEQVVVSDRVETVQFNVANNGQSSSILELGIHKHHHPHVWYTEKHTVETRPLFPIITSPKYAHIPFNFLNLDIQGVELKALKGMEEYLKRDDTVKYIYTEVNCDYVYENCSLVGEIDEYLGQYGFKRVETNWCCDYKWGDAFYVRP